MVITKVSRLTGKESSREIDITEEQLARVGGPELIQNIVPHLSADDREFLLSGITPEEWDKAFPEEDEDEDLDEEDHTSTDVEFTGDEDDDDGTYDHDGIDPEEKFYKDHTTYLERHADLDDDGVEDDDSFREDRGEY